MLRTKQLGTLSHCARSFFLNGSRSSTADGTPCTSSEDETCIVKKPTKSSNTSYQQKPSTVVSRSLPVASKPAGYNKAEPSECLTSLPHGHSLSYTSLRSDGASPINDGPKGTSHSTKKAADQLVKSNIATVGFFTDLVNHKLSALDGGSLLTTPQKCVIDSKPISNLSATKGNSQKRANVKSSRKSVDIGGLNSGLSANLSAEIKSKTSSLVEISQPVSNAKVRTSKTLQPVPNTQVRISEEGFRPVPSAKVRNTEETFQHVPSTEVRTFEGLRHVPTTKVSTSEGSEILSLVPQDFRQCIPQRAKNHSHVAANSKPAGRICDRGGAENSRYVEKVPQNMRSIRVRGGFTPFSPSTNSGRAVDSVYQILQQLKWGPATEEALANIGCTFDAYHANQVLKLLHDHTVAHSFFYWLKHQPGFKHDEHSYTTMVGILGRARQFGAIDRLLNEMIRDGSHPNVVTYNRLIHSYGRANFLNEAVNVFHKMQQVGCIPDRVTYCTLIDIHAKAGFLNVAMDMYKRMQQAGLSPDTFTYSVIINCLGKAGHLSSAYKLFCEMVSRGCIPNLVTYNIMIALQTKARNYPNALKLYRDMQNAGFRPDRVTYNIVMEVLGHCGYLNEAEALFAEMKREDWVPDEPVYGLLVDLWGKAGNVEKARSWYQLMLESGLKPNVPTCNSLLSAFLRVHQFSEAYDLLQNMVKFGLSPSLQTYTLLLSCCTDVRYHADMGLCGELMSITGHPAHVFLVTMPAAGPDGKNVHDHVRYFLDLMQSEDRESKRGLVDAVIDFLHKSGLKEEAGSVWEVAAQKNVYPDAVREKSSCYWLINLHLMSDGTAVVALSRTLAWFRRRMMDSGVTPTRIDIVTGWGRRSRVTGSSLVRQSVQELLDLFRFPFFTQNGNTGCFVGSGEPLNAWLRYPYVERMHLL